MAPLYRVAFFGTPDFAVPALQALCEQAQTYALVGAFTQPDRPAGRGRRIQPAPVKVAAAAHHIPCFAPTRLREQAAVEQFMALQADVAIVAAYGRLLPSQWLAAPRFGCINLHASLLPAHRGASPIAHAILAGQTHTGISMMQMEQGLDTGPVYHRASLPILPIDTCGSLTEKLAAMAADVLLALLPTVLAGQTHATPQSALGDGEPSYAPLLDKAAGELRLADSAASLARRVRAFCPWPGTFMQRGERRLGIIRADEVVGAPKAAPGIVLQASAQGIDVACGGEALRLLEVKPAGKAAMSCGAWLQGRKIAVGQSIYASI